MTKKFTFDDIQPRAEMLIDALRNKGACASGMNYEPAVYAQADHYYVLLQQVREGKITKHHLDGVLRGLSTETIIAAKNNQKYRIEQIVNGLDYFINKEYNKYNGNKE